jgi:hypothetical protein
MSWSAPMTAVANTAFTAAQFNQYVRDNLNESAPAKATGAGGFIVANGVNSVIQRDPGSNTVNTSETSANTSYTNLATAGPAVTATSDARAIVWFTAQMNNNSASQETITSVAVSGATTIASSDNYCLDVQQPAGGSAFVDVTTSRAVRLTVTPGSNTYTMEYRVTGGTGTFRRRSIVVLPG